MLARATQLSRNKISFLFKALYILQFSFFFFRCSLYQTSINNTKSDRGIHYTYRTKYHGYTVVKFLRNTRCTGYIDISEISWPKFLRGKLAKIEERMEGGSVTECLCLRGPICPAIG